MQISLGRVILAEGARSAKALGQDHAWHDGNAAGALVAGTESGVGGSIPGLPRTPVVVA